MIYIGSDHAGYQLKSQLIDKMNDKAMKFEDMGTYSAQSVDYPEIAQNVAHEVKKHHGSFGILLCSSGQGMCIAANRLKGVRCALVWNREIAEETRLDNDANIISLPAKFLDQDKAWDILTTFLTTPFSQEDRHIRRIKHIDEE